jgi:hypothetical protein
MNSASAGFTTMQREREGYYNAMEAMNTGTYKGDGDILDWSQWDRFQVDGTTPVLVHRLFQQGLGSPGGVAGNKNLADTNMVGNIGIPQGQKLYIRAIKVFYKAVEIRTEAECVSIYQLFADTTINLSIPGKDTYGQWSLDEIMGIPTSVVETPSTAGDNYSLLSTGRHIGILPLNLPIVLSSLVNLTCEVVHQVAPSADLDDDVIKISLNGILERLS